MTIKRSDVRTPYAVELLDRSGFWIVNIRYHLNGQPKARSSMVLQAFSQFLERQDRTRSERYAKIAAKLLKVPYLGLTNKIEIGE